MAERGRDPALLLHHLRLPLPHLLEVRSDRILLGHRERRALHLEPADFRDLDRRPHVDLGVVHEARPRLRRLAGLEARLAEHVEVRVRDRLAERLLDQALQHLAGRALAEVFLQDLARRLARAEALDVRGAAHLVEVRLERGVDLRRGDFDVEASFDGPRFFDAHVHRTLRHIAAPAARGRAP